jgi:hypothetical protein
LNTDGGVARAEGKEDGSLEAEVWFMFSLQMLLAVSIEE